MEVDADNLPQGYDAFHTPFGNAGPVTSGLYYARNRYYSPELGRFISEDPAGLAGGLHPYAYCGGDPINFTDPLGLWATSSYFGDVGAVVRGHGKAAYGAVNMVGMARGLKGLYDKAYACGIGNAAAVAGSGLWHSFTDWTTTSDPEAFGESFGNTLIAVVGAAAPRASCLGAFNKCFIAGTLSAVPDGWGGMVGTTVRTRCKHQVLGLRGT